MVEIDAQSTTTAETAEVVEESKIITTAPEDL